MKIDNSHYGDSMSPLDVQLKCDTLIAKMIAKHPKTSFILCYTGMSGVASATILGLELQKRNLLEAMVYVRKSDEESHGERVEVCSFRTKTRECVIYFIDDFMETGGTYEHVKEQCYMFTDSIIETINQYKSNNFFDLLNYDLSKKHIHIGLVKTMEIKMPC